MLHDNKLVTNVELILDLYAHLSLSLVVTMDTVFTSLLQLDGPNLVRHYVVRLMKGLRHVRCEVVKVCSCQW